MSGVISLLSWIIQNWQLLATAFSATSSIALFFMHGSAAQELAELKDFVNSLNISQSPTSNEQLIKDTAKKV